MVNGPKIDPAIPEHPVQLAILDQFAADNKVLRIVQMTSRAGRAEPTAAPWMTNRETDSYPVIHQAGDSALLVEFGDRYASEVSRAVLAFDEAMGSAPEGVVETAPTVRSVLIVFDPLRLNSECLLNWCRSLLGSRDWYCSEAAGQGRTWVLPVVYGGAAGPDLNEIAELAGTNARTIIQKHEGSSLTVLCLGFSPGLAYLAELPEEFAVPRREAFGKPVPAGSVLIANRQSVLPATPIPTGWRCIGRTPLRTFTPSSGRPFLLSPGDTVRFAQISENEARAFDQRAFLKEHGIAGPEDR